VNEVVVHGIPSPYVLKDGDVFTIDIGLIYKGFHTDTAGTKIIGPSKKHETFLEIGRLALQRGIDASIIGNHVGDISKVVQETIEGAWLQYCEIVGGAWGWPRAS